ncbi:MAG: hypothetical protein H0T60_13140 [Acidobacteria bacterium]|nr:hypothetical protein [Acidobacteriota bacterium]
MIPTLKGSHRKLRPFQGRIISSFIPGAALAVARFAPGYYLSPFQGSSNILFRHAFGEVYVRDDNHYDD